MRQQIFYFVFYLLLLMPGVARAQDAAKGEQVFKKCIACHAVGEGARNKTGPQLNGFFGRKAGAAEGYNYSPAYTNSDLVWDEANFSAYIKDPQGMMPGSRMAFAGLQSPDEVKDLIAYLKQFGSGGKKSE